MDPATIPTRAAAFSEQAFYLGEFRGRTLAIAYRAPDLVKPAALESVLAELEANPTRVVLISTEAEAITSLLDTRVLSASVPNLEGAVWRALGQEPRIGVVSDSDLASGCRDVALRLGLSKLVWLDPEGGLRRAEGGIHSFVDLDALRALLGAGLAGESARRAALLKQVESLLAAGLPALNLCAPEGVADELFSYAGSGTLFTRERYVKVRRLGIDDYDAADDLIARGVAEGYLAARSSAEIERILASGIGAFVEGRHLAGIGALLVYDEPRIGEIASLYTLTRFLGEGVGSHLVRFALDWARDLRCTAVVACTTSDRVVRFFEQHGFERVAQEALPEEKWRSYDRARRARLCCLRREIG